MFKETIFAVASSGFAIAALAWLAKKIVSHFLSKDIEVFKTRLEAQSQVELEKLRNSLQRIAYEHEVVFSHLHKRRIDVILELHSALLDIKNAVEKVVTPHQGPEFHQVRHDNAKDAASKAVAFYKLFERKKLFLDEKLAVDMDAFVTELYRFNGKFTVEMNTATAPDARSRYGSEFEVWDKSWQSFEKELKPVLASLESQFRHLLGVRSFRK